VSYRAADSLLKQQTKLVENQIDAFAGNLHAAAGASGLRNLVDTQVRRIPQNAARFAGDTRDAFGVLADAGREAGSVLKDTVVDLRDRRVTPASKRTAGKTASKTARKSARKTAKKTRSAAPTGKKAKKVSKRSRSASRAA
jgi:phasin family protein